MTSTVLSVEQSSKIISSQLVYDWFITESRHSFSVDPLLYVGKIIEILGVLFMVHRPLHILRSFFSWLLPQVKAFDEPIFCDDISLNVLSVSRDTYSP